MLAAPNGPPVRRGRLAFAIRLVVSAGLITYLLWRIPLERVLATVAASDVALLAVAFALHASGFLLSALRWRLLLTAVIRPPKLWSLMRAYLIGVFCNQFLPSTIGGDLYRSLDVAALSGLPRGQSLAVVVVERTIGALALFSYAAAALVLGFGHLVDKPGVVASIGVLGLLFAGLLVLLTPWSRAAVRRQLARGPLARLLPALDRAFGAAKDIGQRKRVLAGAVVLSLVFQLNVVIHYILVGTALGLPLGLEAYFLVIPVVLLVLQVPASLNGVGLREFLFVVFLSPAVWGAEGATESGALAYGLTVWAMILLQGMVGGVFFALRRRMVGGLDSGEGGG
ncbi:MAG: flippase-like domain-containing protein [Planctomycetes bacterium]|nr:flippase-like domain-containing protein [Planctomycetota bacterium]